MFFSLLLGMFENVHNKMFSVLNLVHGSKVTLEFLHFTSNFLSINCVPNIVFGIGNPMTQSCPVPACGVQSLVGEMYIQIITQKNDDFHNQYKAVGRHERL